MRTGSIINLFIREPLLIAHKTGSSLEDANSDAFSALTANRLPIYPRFFSGNLSYNAIVIKPISSIKAKTLCLIWPF